jgi:UDP-N-acetylmuramoylalanine--D-glutamate ligase
MTPWEAFFRGKRVTLLGLGLLGRGIGDARFMSHCGAQVTVTDKKTEAQLTGSLAALKDVPGLTFHLGGHRREDFTDTDMVIKGAGVRLDSPEVAAAREAGVPVYMSTALAARFARELGVRIVGMTGTRGKSTVTQMIAHTLSTAGRRALVGGNIRGLSTLELLPQLNAGDILVLELDSWQLQGFGDLTLSPDIAVFTNLMPDHQNYYVDMESYFADKANIFRYQRTGDALICGAEILPRIEAVRSIVEPSVPDALADGWVLKVIGEHNRENAALARDALRALGLSDDEIHSGLESFEPVEGRLQLVREVNGVKIYNDNNATTPEATIAALRALDTGKKDIVLIMGGADKFLDMSALLYEVAKTCKRVILLSGTGTDRIAPLMQDYSIFDELGSAVREAVASAQPGDIILFSPAFASFGMFTNEYERNDEFLRIVRNVI